MIIYKFSFTIEISHSKKRLIFILRCDYIDSEQSSGQKSYKKMHVPAMWSIDIVSGMR